MATLQKSQLMTLQTICHSEVDMLTVKEISERLKGRVISDVVRYSFVSRPTIQKIIDTPECKVNYGTIKLLSDYLKAHK